MVRAPVYMEKNLMDTTEFMACRWVRIPDPRIGKFRIRTLAYNLKLIIY